MSLSFRGKGGNIVWAPLPALVVSFTTANKSYEFFFLRKKGGFYEKGTWNYGETLRVLKVRFAVCSIDTVMPFSILSPNYSVLWTSQLFNKKRIFNALGVIDERR